MKLRQIKGQDKAINQLFGAIIKDRISHAYLFAGPEGVGKFLTALAFANGLNCQSPHEGDSCGTCLSCRRFASGNNSMVTVIEPEGMSIKIDQIRTLQEKLKYSIEDGQRHIVVLREAHVLTLQGANSLLKVIEEPPPNTIFVLTTSQQHSLLPTIISRCQVVKFNFLGYEVLEEILIQKGFTSQERKLACLMAKGSAKRALELCQTEDIMTWQYQSWEMLQHIFSKDYLKIMEKIDYWEEEEYSLAGILDALAVWYRDYLIWKETGEDDLLIEKTKKGEFERYQQDLDTILIHLEMITECQQILQSTANEKNNVETLLLNLSRIA
ncbi:DNA polymerase-3 subunit delta' [Desulfitispora alkaliphila]|uniref:DNA polymerase III subunit delta' n=1 Tax=Desulfitispora alkaliphila TaxID=622674 RepID=UPI003D2264AD